MKVSDLRFDYPESLIATEPLRPSRVLWVDSEGNPEEITIRALLEKFKPGDLLVLNNTKVLRRRVFAPLGNFPSTNSATVEILFLNSEDGLSWQVLFPSKKFKVGDSVLLPLGVKMTLLEKGRPQRVLTDRKLDEDYFQKVAELPLPPYIQKMRSDRHNVALDESWYQTAWASRPGSFAAPTASLHFSKEDLNHLKKFGVEMVEVTLHVGLGTFLSVTSEDLDQHEMHSEFVEISGDSWQKILAAKTSEHLVWSLGTTATRAVESAAKGQLEKNQSGGFSGFTKLLIQPGYKWEIVDRLMTNFHQPESTLLALVAGFSDLVVVKRAYQFAIERKFRLFSYGDLSVWERTT